MSEDAEEQLAEWIDRADEALGRLEEHIEARELGATLETLKDLVEVADAAEDLLEEVDLTDLPAGIEGDELIEAIEAGDIPEAISEGDPKEMVDMRALIKAVQLRNLWNSMDVTQVLEEKEELEEEFDELTDDDEAGMKEKVSSYLEDDESADDEAGMKEKVSSYLEDDESADDEAGMKEKVGSYFGDDEEEEREDEDEDEVEGPVDIPSQEYQETIQAKAIDAVEEFRDGVKRAHRKLKEFREKNKEKMRRQHEETKAESRNPTAYSSLPTERPDIEGNAARFSSVPNTVRHSTAPSFDRIYGNRYDQE